MSAILTYYCNIFTLFKFCRNYHICSQPNDEACVEATIMYPVGCPPLYQWSNGHLGLDTTKQLGQRQKIGLHWTRHLAVKPKVFVGYWQWFQSTFHWTLYQAWAYRRCDEHLKFGEIVCLFVCCFFIFLSLVRLSLPDKIWIFKDVPLTEPCNLHDL